MKHQTPTPAPLAPAVDLPAREAYSACLRLLAEVVRRVEDPVLRAQWLADQSASRNIGLYNEHLLDLLGSIFRMVHPVFWSRDIPVPPFRGTDEPLIQETIRQRPGDPVLNDAFIYFEEPVFIPGWVIGQQTEYELTAIPIRAIAIGVAPPHLAANYADVVIALGGLDTAKFAIPIGLILKLGEIDRLKPPGWYNASDSVEDGPVQRYLWRLAYHCMTFMSQRVDVSRERGPANRQTRKEAERILRRTPPEVVIVHYRRPAAPAERSEPTGRTLSVQFDVDGFWRNQRVGPGRKVVRRTWVSGFHKGPPDAPWSRSPVKIAAVVR